MLSGSVKAVGNGNSGHCLHSSSMQHWNFVKKRLLLGVSPVAGITTSTGAQVISATTSSRLSHRCSLSLPGGGANCSASSSAFAYFSPFCCGSFSLLARALSVLMYLLTHALYCFTLSLDKRQISQPQVVFCDSVNFRISGGHNLTNVV